MRFIHNMSIRRKQVLTTMLASSAALLLACASFMAYDAHAFRRELIARLTSLADVVANNTTAALDFNDPESATETLAALRGEPTIALAHIHGRGGEEFARYVRDGATVPDDLPEDLTASHAFVGDHLLLVRPITHAGEHIGTIDLVAGLGELSERMTRYFGIVAAVFLAALLVTLALSARLQRLISVPVLELARVARIVAKDRDYSVRARRHGDDELGELIETFNEMLDQIQIRDDALQTTRATLKCRVEERTAELARSLSVLNATFDSMADGILAVDLLGKVVNHNRRFLTLWNFPDDIVERLNGAEMLTFAATLSKYPDAFLERVDAMRAAPQCEHFDVIELADGRTMERTAHPHYLGDTCVGSVLNFRDITERRLADERLEMAHRKLLQTSRLAGMAEVATGVLHNVGNVLNSINVSTTLMAERVRTSEVRNLARVSALLRDHQSNLAEFLTQHPKGRQVPPFLESLARHLVTEQEELIKELEQLRKNVEHIKEIVAMQQSYAKVSGVAETVDLVDLVDDAIRMNAGALVRHEVTIVRDYCVRPTITVEKHKILQILVNLIRNAKYACTDSDRSDKQMIVRITAAGSRVQITVIDNGVGIAAENLTRIFAHGFTTRTNGHGFGLHSGALAAREMNGALSAHSDGPGHGASFTLELPFEPQARAA